MTKKELVQKLSACAAYKTGFDTPDTERAHQEADRLLLQYIDSAEVTAAFDEHEKWYA